MIGAGGLGGEIGEGLVRKGYGEVTIIDHDKVELTNLNRQRFFEHDIGKYKAFRLAKNLEHEGFFNTQIRGIPLRFEDAIKNGSSLACDVAICGVDNDAARVSAARHYYGLGIPVIFTAICDKGDHGYVFVQQPGQACFGCFKPEAIGADAHTPCPSTARLKDILKVVAGVVLYAVDSLLMNRLRLWNYREIFLDGSIPEFCAVIQRKQECQLCHPGTKQS